MNIEKQKATVHDLGEGLSLAQVECRQALLAATIVEWERSCGPADCLAIELVAHDIVCDDDGVYAAFTARARKRHPIDPTLGPFIPVKISHTDPRGSDERMCLVRRDGLLDRDATAAWLAIATRNCG